MAKKKAQNPPQKAQKADKDTNTNPGSISQEFAGVISDDEQAYINFLGTKLGVFIASLDLSEAEREQLLTLVEFMRIDQLEWLLSELEAKYYLQNNTLSRQAFEELVLETQGRTEDKKAHLFKDAAKKVEDLGKQLEASTKPA